MIEAIKLSTKKPISARDLLFPDDKKTLFISDNKIWKNCAKFFDKNFLSQNSHLLLENPEANLKTLKKIIKAAKNYDFIFTLGSGTLNDLSKLAALELKISYSLLASATSMNGYVSKNASMEIKGHKKTLPATLPNQVFYHLGIFKKSPTTLIKAGIGDAMCFYSCWFDWYLSHLLLKTPFNQEPFDLLKNKMTNFTKSYHKLSDEKLLESLFQILLISGRGMTIAGGSYPASQSEHLIAHSLSMKYPSKMKNILHGNQIAITTLTSANLQKKLLTKKTLQLTKQEFPSKKISEFFGAQTAKECKKEFLQKKFDEKKLNTDLKINWPKYRAKLTKLHFNEKKLKAIFQHFKIATSFKNVSKQQYQSCIFYSQFIRNRFTCLDIDQRFIF